ncbi:MAG: hypothetical protein P8182_11860 [Deltaproteobacteria bacterium]
MIRCEKMWLPLLVIGLLLPAGMHVTGRISFAASPFPMTGYANPSPYRGRQPLQNLRRAVERAAERYARGGMENPVPYDRVYRRYQHAENWYYSDAGPGGRALQRWLRRQSIYSGSSRLPKRGYLRRTPGL